MHNYQPSSGPGPAGLSSSPARFHEARLTSLRAALLAAVAISLGCPPARAALTTPTVGNYDPNGVPADSAMGAAGSIMQKDFAGAVAKSWVNNLGGVINFEKVRGTIGQNVMIATYGLKSNRFGGTNMLTITADTAFMGFQGLQAIRADVLTPQPNLTPSGGFVLDAISYGKYGLVFSTPLDQVGVTVLGDLDASGANLNITATVIDSAGAMQTVAGIMVPRGTGRNLFIGFQSQLNPIVELQISDANGNRFELDDLGFITAPHTFVRGSPSTITVQDTELSVVPIVFLDTELPAILQKFPGSTMDIVMQQCHSGGFVPYLNSAPPVGDWTFCSGCTLAESCMNYDGLGNTTQGALDNWTRSWREDAQLYQAAGMRAHFQTTLTGHAAQAAPAIAAITRDPFVPNAILPFVTAGAVDLATGKFVPEALVPVVTGTYRGTAGSWAYYMNTWVQLMPTVAPIAGNWQVVAPGRAPGLLPGGGPFPALPGNPAGAYRGSMRALPAENNPQYTSPSSANPANTASDMRSLLPDADSDLYAILVQWDEDFSGESRAIAAERTTRFAANIARMYNTLTGPTYMVPANNIVVLYYDGFWYDEATRKLPQFTLFPGPNATPNEVLASVPIDGQTGTNNAKQFLFNNDAILGNLFKTGNPGTPGGNVPGPDDHLLVYMTGHGISLSGNARKHYDNIGFGVQVKVAVDAVGAADTSVPGFDPVSEYVQAYEETMASTNTDATNVFSNPGLDLTNFVDAVDLIQISTTQPIPYGVQLTVNGYSDPSWMDLQPISDTNTVVYDLDPIVPGMVYSNSIYQIEVSNSLLYADLTLDTNAAADAGGYISFNLNGLPLTSFDPNFVSSVIIRGVEQEGAYVPPDPTAVSELTGVNIGEFLLTWPAGLNGFVIQTNSDLTTTNWGNVYIPGTNVVEVTGIADSSLPMGPNWALFPFSGSQLFFRLQPQSP